MDRDFRVGRAYGAALFGIEAVVVEVQAARAWGQPRAVIVGQAEPEVKEGRERLKVRSYDREYKRVARSGGGPTPGQTVVPIPFRLKTAQDVLALLAEQIEAVRGDDTLTTVERARTVGYLAGITLKAIEAGDLSARLEAVKAVLKQRRDG